MLHYYKLIMLAVSVWKDMGESVYQIITPLQAK